MLVPTICVATKKYNKSYQVNGVERTHVSKLACQCWMPKAGRRNQTRPREKELSVTLRCLL